MIQQINGQQIRTADDVQQAVDKSQIGGSLPVAVSRNGQNVTVSVRPDEFPAKAG